MEKEFLTSNLDIAAYLLATGQPLVSTARQGKFTVFLFPPSAANRAADFIAGAAAPANALLDSYRKLRTIISSQQKGAKQLCQINQIRK